jgi:hypothetical protein
LNKPKEKVHELKEKRRFKRKLDFETQKPTLNNG